MPTAEPIEAPVEEQVDLDGRYLELAAFWPKDRVEVVNDRIVVKFVPTGAHNDIVFWLLTQLIPVVKERGWKIWPDIALFFGSQQDRYRPDLTVVPLKPRMWGADHIHAAEALLVAEVVSRSSADDDHTIKPKKYASAGIPLCLIVDGLAGKIRLLSEPGPKGYEQETDILLGHPLDLPEPWGITLDTAQLTD